MVWYGFVPGWQILLLPGVRRCWPSLASLGAGAVDHRRSTSNTATSATSFRSSCSSGSMSRRSASQLERRAGSSGGCSTSLNPMVGVIDGFRWCMLGGDSPLYWPGFCISLARRRRSSCGSASASSAASKRSFADLI